MTFQNKKASAAASEMAVNKQEDGGPNMWTVFTWLNRLLGVSVMVTMAYYWAGYLAQLHDNQFWFVNIKVRVSRKKRLIASNVIFLRSKSERDENGFGFN